MKKWLSCTVISLSLLAAITAHAEPTAKPVDAKQPASVATQKSGEPNANQTEQPPKPDAAQIAQELQDAGDEALKGIVIHKHPEDFPSAQQLAQANRQERIEAMQKSIVCIQQATDMDGLNDCIKNERKDMDKIRLSYCATAIMPLANNVNVPKNKKKAKKENKGNKGAVADANASATDAANQQPEPAAHHPTACDKALAAITGKRIPKAGTMPLDDGTQ